MPVGRFVDDKIACAGDDNAQVAVFRRALRDDQLRFAARICWALGVDGKLRIDEVRERYVGGFDRLRRLRDRIGYDYGHAHRRRGGFLRMRVQRKAGCAHQSHVVDLARSLAHRDLGKELERMNEAEEIRLDE